MRRREFITLLGNAAAWPVAARAQQPERMRSIGVLMGYAESDREGQTFLAAFREELSKKFGWTEGQNIRIDTRWAAPNDTELRLQFAKELVALHPDLVVSHGTPSTAALLQQTRTLPIIFVNVSDPIGSGFVTSFAKPGGNSTGFVTMEPTMAGKWMELLKEIAPRVTRSALLFNPTTAPYAEYFLDPFKAAAASFAVEAAVEHADPHRRRALRHLPDPRRTLRAYSPITIISTLPSAGLGALLLLMAFHYDLSVIAIVGIILLIGIVKKNGMMLVDFALHTEQNEGLTAEEEEEIDLQGLCTALSADPDDHDGGVARRRADDDRYRRRLRASPAARLYHRRRLSRVATADALHHAGGIYLSRSVGTFPGQLPQWR